MNTLRIALALVALAALAAADGSLFTGFGGGSAEAGSRRGPQPESPHLFGALRDAASALNPINWVHKVAQNVPKIEDISFRHLISLPLQQASTLIKAITQNSYLQQWTGSLYVPNWSNVKLNLITAHSNVSVQVKSASELKRYQQLASGEVTVFITGLPCNPEDPSDAVAQLIEAYRERYQIGQSQGQGGNSWESSTSGNLIVCDLGDQLNSFQRWTTVDIEECGKQIGQAIAEISEIAPYYNIHLIGHSQGAHVAGAAAKQFTRKTGKQLRRVTGLDPNKLFTQAQHSKSELSRGVADFVDVIHTTPNGVSSKTNGDVDFYPNGKNAILVGAKDIIDASEKAIEYFAESVRPDCEKNFMATECDSLENYDKRQCNGIRVPMGYATPTNAKGDFILKVNSNSPYGKNSRASKNSRGRAFSYE